MRKAFLVLVSRAGFRGTASSRPTSRIDVTAIARTARRRAGPVRRPRAWAVRAVLGVLVLLPGCVDEQPLLGEAITLASGGASNPTVAVGADGVVHVAWIDAHEDQSNVWVASSVDGIAFGEPVRVNDIPGDAAPHEQAPAQIETGPDGALYVVWQRNTPAPGRRFPYSDLRFARSTDGGRTFQPAITVNDDLDQPPSSHTFHDVLVAADGTVWVSWIDGRVAAALAAANSPVDDAAATAVGAGHAGHDLAVAGSVARPGPKIRIARSTDGGRSFDSSVVVAGDACPCCRTALAVGPAAELYVGWRTVLEADVRDVVVARSNDRGTTWNPATRVHADDWAFDACPHAGPSVAVDGDGRVHVAWYTGAAPAPGIYTAVSTDRGSTFGNVRPVLTGEWVPPSQVKLAVRDDASTLVAWDDRRAESPVVRVAVAAARTGRLHVESTGLRGTSPAVAANAGVAALAWLDGESIRVRTARDKRHSAR